MRATLLRANVAYAIGSAANSLALFLLIPFLVNALPTEAYGAWALFEVAILLLSMTVLGGMDVGLMREYWFLENEEARRALSGTVVGAMLLWGALVVLGGSAGMGLVLQRGWGASLLPAGLSYTVLWLVMGIGYAEALFSLLLSLFRIREQAVPFVVLSVGRMILFLVGAVVGVEEVGGVTGALAGRFVAAVVGVAVAAFFTRRFMAPTFDRQRLRAVVRYGLPLLPTNVAMYLLFASDRYVLQWASTLEVVGIYSFAYKVATTLDVLVIRPFSIDWAPRRFAIAARPAAPQQYAKVLLIYMFAAGGFALLILASSGMVYRWVAPPTYQAGLAVIPILLLAYFLYGLSYPLNVGIMLKDQTHLLPLISWITAGVCVGLNLLWVPRFGMVGAAWATVVAYALQTSGLTWFSLRVYPIPYPKGPLLGFVGALLTAFAGLVGLDALLGGGDGMVVAWVLKMGWVAAIWGGLALPVAMVGTARGAAISPAPCNGGVP